MYGSNDILIRKKGDVFLLYMPSLGLVAKDQDLRIAHDRLLKNKVEYLAELKELGIPEAPESSGTLKRLLRNPLGAFDHSHLTSFFIKVLIVAVFIGGATLFTANLLVYRLKSYASNLKSNVASVMHQEKERIHSLIMKVENMPPEKIQKRKELVRRLVSKTSPIAEELRPLVKKLSCP